MKIVSKMLILMSLLFMIAGCAGEHKVAPKAAQPDPKVAQASPKNTVASAVKPAKDIKVTFIELGSVGCVPCDMMRPILDDIEKEYEGQVLVRFYDVRSLFGRPYAEKYAVRMIPTQVFLDKDGNEYYRHVGFFEKAEIIKVLQMQGVK
jgi:thioredoxin 1